ncbi:MAG: methyltransferase [Microvirga sp.]
MAEIPERDEITDDALLAGRIRLLQPVGGHRAGTDAVLLSAAANARPGDTVVDVGAGTGAVGLMVGAREPKARLIFVERELDLVDLCRRNVERAGIDGKVVAADMFYRISRRAAGLVTGVADIVLTNPPYLEGDKSRPSPDKLRALAHVMPSGGLDAWIQAGIGLLKPRGRLVLIHRADRAAACLAAMDEGLGGVKLRAVHPTQDRPASRILISGIRGSKAPLEIVPPLVLHGPDGRFTPEAEAIHRGEAFLP